MQQLVELFSKPPASFAWSKSEDGQRTIGTSEGFVLDIWPDRIEAAALFPPDRAGLAARNGILLQLLLAALRPEWKTPGGWLEEQMRASAAFRPTRDKPAYEFENTEQRLVWIWDRTHSRATLKVRV